MRKFVSYYCKFTTADRVGIERRRLGGGHHHASRSRQYHFVICDCSECQRIRRLGWVSIRLPKNRCVVLLRIQTDEKEGYLCHLHSEEASPIGTLSLRWSRYA